MDDILIRSNTLDIAVEILKIHNQGQTPGENESVRIDNLIETFDPQQPLGSKARERSKSMFLKYCVIVEVTSAREESSNVEQVFNEVNSNIQWEQHLPMWIAS